MGLIKMAHRSMLIVLLLAGAGYAYNILIMHPTPSFSHQQSVMALTEALIKRGHQLFVISPNVVPGLEKNYTYIDVSFTYDVFSEDGDSDDTVNTQQQMSKWELPITFKAFNNLPSVQFDSPQFKTFMARVEKEKIKFDVALMETYYVPTTCAMTRLLNGHSPIISISTLPTDMYGESNLGSIEHGSFAPSVWGSVSDKMNLWEKIENWVTIYYIKYRMRENIEEAAHIFFRQFYPEHETLIDGCWTNITLSMITANFITYYPRLLGPNVIEIGPLHMMDKPPKLQQNVQDWLDGAEKGVIYFSLGSNMKSKSLPAVVRENFLKLFRQLPSGYRVLWKWELDGPIPGQSDNILPQKWMMQQSVLNHPKVKAFITQGGLQSFQEAVHYGVPTVGIPWFGDQEMDVAKMIDAGIGTRIRPQELYSYEKVKSAIETVLFDER
uniref:UDP-glucuronosyltransferase n=1 Tax=Trialeurodes vaporariorum TaxID=88556 RepID=A0A873P531_TRIVP|nr:UDP-gluconosyltransferase [Trialeurodes vaporariorum]